MCLVQAANDSAALANTWTQLGSPFSITNSSGSGGTLGQGQSRQTTSATVANGEYIGVVITNIPNTGHADSMISVQFELEANVAMV
jgi:tripartite-type tricarboxylate transporter receptor subunit TctC